MVVSNETPVRVRLNDRQRLDWLQLLRSENVGPAIFRDLLNYFGSAGAALEALPDLARRGGSKKRIRIAPLEAVEREMHALEQLGARLVAPGEEGYPSLLQHIHAPPPLLAIRGSLTIAAQPALAIVGGRNSSLAGRKLAGEIATDLGNAGYSIVSGLARGIDAAAHHAALKTGTIAVLAGGPDIIYPPEHDTLARDILDQGGAIISEMPLSWQPRARDFPRRNRLISGTGLATILVEAAARSGSLHTAKFALEQGRDVLAIPGSPKDPRASGCNSLIRQGATLVTSAHDILEAVRAQNGLFETSPPLSTPYPVDRIQATNEATTQSAPAANTDDHRQAILGALGSTPQEVDELSRFLQIDIREINLILLELEIAGKLERHAGHKVSLV
ncbi:MAG: DNA-processing protein DprA [Stappiaceae bacterium]